MSRILIVILLCSAAFGQDKFWDAQRKVETGVYAGAVALDGWSTQNGIRQGGFVEENPFARPFVYHGIGGQFTASAIGLAAGIVPSFLLYRSGHKTLSRVWLHVFTVGESVNAGQMFYLVTHHQ